MRQAVVLTIVLAAVGATPVLACTAQRPSRSRSTAWLDARHGWADSDAAGYHGKWSDDGGRTWREVISIGHSTLTVRMSRTAAIAEFTSGGYGSPSFREFAWTNDGGRHWYLGGPRMSQTAAFAGRRNLLFWHDRGDTIYRVAGWPPRGVYPCAEVNREEGLPPGHKLCDGDPSDHGMRSVVAARLDRGVFQGAMRSVLGGVAALAYDSSSEKSYAAVYREGSLSLAELPVPHRAGGYVASARVGTRPALVIRQLDRTRPLLALAGSAGCGSLELRADWPNIVVEGRRRGVTRVVWLSKNGGYRWTRFVFSHRSRCGTRAK